MLSMPIARMDNGNTNIPFRSSSTNERRVSLAQVKGAEREHSRLLLFGIFAAKCDLSFVTAAKIQYLEHSYSHENKMKEKYFVFLE